MATREGARRGKNKGKTTVAPAPWRRVRIDVVDIAQDAVTSLLLDEEALGVEVIDDETRAVPGEHAVKTGRAEVIATFDTIDGLERRIAARLSNVAKNFEGITDLSLQWEDVVDEDWNANFKAQWEPLKLGDRVWVVPSWREHTPEGDDIVLELDPGMAFGTGTHETTQLCLRALEKLCVGEPIAKSGLRLQTPARARVLDVGTGSGILAIAAKKLGAALVKGTDNDPHAVKVAQENAVHNGTEVQMSIDPPHHWGPSFDVVIANILAPTLVALASEIAGAIAPGGILMLSGVLEPQASNVIRAYTDLGLTHAGTEQQGDWVRIDLRR